MNDWQARVIEERAQLADRLQKLQALIESPESVEMDAEDLVLLFMQYGMMSQYHGILSLRVRRFGGLQ